MSLLLSETTVTTCRGCGRPTGTPPAAWSMAVVDGIRRWTCPPCVRAELAAIETGVPLR